MNLSPGRTDPAAVLRDHPRLRVRCVLRRDDELTDALLDLAARDRQKWTVQEWGALLTELETCDDTLADWLIFNS